MVEFAAFPFGNNGQNRDRQTDKQTQSSSSESPWACGIMGDRKSSDLTDAEKNGAVETARTRSPGLGNLWRCVAIDMTFPSAQKSVFNHLTMLFFPENSCPLQMAW
jgi:hypothetical protein